MTWQEELRRNIKNSDGLAEYISLTEDEKARIDAVLKTYPMSVTRYYMGLIDPNDPDDPIRAMAVPNPYEFDTDGSFDTSGEAGNTVAEGVQHKYEETAMVLSTNACAMYCRHCFRKRLVGISENEIVERLDVVRDYIAAHPEINNVLISGGDAFLNPNAVIRSYLEGLAGIEGLDLIRFGTRTPVVFPQRITDDKEFLDILEKYNTRKQLYVVTQFNHPKELTSEAKEAVRALLRAGVVVKNQTVLLRGINDSEKVLGALLSGITAMGVIPYYVFQCRPVTGVKNRFQVPINRSYEIIEGAKGMQNGQGKCIRYIMSHRTGKIEIVGRLPDGSTAMKYHQAKDPSNKSRMFAVRLRDDQCWLESDPE